jgi:hypothetical protein
MVLFLACSLLSLLSARRRLAVRTLTPCQVMVPRQNGLMWEYLHDMAHQS